MHKELINLILASISDKDDSERNRSAIQSVIYNYFDGTKLGDVNLIRKAFHESAKLKHIKPDGDFYEADLNHFVNYLEKNGGMPVIESHILAIDISETAAKVKVIFVFEDFIYIDYLNLLCENNKWLIVDKVYVKKQIDQVAKNSN